MTEFTECYSFVQEFYTSDFTIAIASKCSHNGTCILQKQQCKGHGQW